MADREFYPRADALGFLAPQGHAPVAVRDLPQHVDLMHVTAAPPFFDSTQETLDGGLSPDGMYRIPGVRAFARTVDDQSWMMARVRTSDAMRATLKENKTAIVLGLQRAPLDADRENIGLLKAAGVSVMAMEYQHGGGRYGSGWMDPEGPLTDEGRQLLHDMAEAGMILDVSHSGDRTASDAVDFIRKEKLPLRVMASHGGIRELYRGDARDINMRRNLSLDTLARVHVIGGVIGIYSLTFGLSSSDDSPAAFYDQLHAAAERFPNAVAIGSDATYAERDPLEWVRTHNFLASNIAAGPGMEPRFPDTPLELNTPSRLTEIGQQLLSDGMRRGMVAGVIGKTLVDFFARSLPRTEG